MRAALARELGLAASAIERFAAGRRLPDALDEVLRTAAMTGLPADSVPAVRDFAYLTVRHWGEVQALADKLNNKPPIAPVAALQKTSLALLCSRAAPSAALAMPGQRHEAVIVDEAVKAAAADAQMQFSSGFLNATLRRYLREREALDQAVGAYASVHWNAPPWWIERLRADHPQDWQAIALASREQAPLTLRVNTRRVTVAQYRDRLAAAGLPADPIGPQGLRLQRAVPVAQLPGFEEGLASVQDAGAQLAAPFLDVADGHRVLDACSAPGGKSTHLLELAQCELLALDSDDSRQQRVRQSLARLHLQAEVRTGDATRPAGWWDKRPFDRILLDAPCSASGIVRRHPDIPWLRRRSDLATLCRVQAEMLEALWPLLTPGGKLLYATCSVFRAEGEGQIERFLSGCDQAVRLPLAWRWSAEAPVQQVAQLLPGHARVDADPRPEAHHVDHDGFFYALLQKRS